MVKLGEIMGQYALRIPNLSFVWLVCCSGNEEVFTPPSASLQEALAASPQV